MVHHFSYLFMTWRVLFNTIFTKCCIHGHGGGGRYWSETNCTKGQLVECDCPLYCVHGYFCMWSCQLPSVGCSRLFWQSRTSPNLGTKCKQYLRVMCFRGSLVFVGSFSGAFSLTQNVAAIALDRRLFGTIIAVFKMWLCPFNQPCIRHPMTKLK